MTKKFLFALVLSSLALFNIQCENGAKATDIKGTVIQGKITNAANSSIFLDKLVIGEASSVITSTKADDAGNFAMAFPEGIKSGVYNLRIDNNRVGMVFDGKEKVIELNGDLKELPKYQFEIKGSQDTRILRDLIQQLISRELDAKGLGNFVDTTSNPELGAFITYMAAGTGLIELQKKALNKLKTANPSSETAVAYEKYIKGLEAKKMSAGGGGPISVGQVAPDIRLASPDGKEYALSDLKGQIVLLDFWASWCRPCRSENPNVVKVYEKYKNKGFTVFSVSLDGNKDRWVGAIKQDKLTWPYHVSDLKKWQSGPARTYGVRSIPRAFLIDREGKIAAVTVRGAAQLESELKKLLK